MKNSKHPHRFEYTNFYLNKILKIGFWKGHYKHYANWCFQGRVNAVYHKIQ